jgi:GNAT superfamily N-acetyltransferase
MIEARTVASEVTVRTAGLEEIASLEPLWLVLYHHHVEVLPTLAGLPIRSAEDSWARRCRMYERWMTDDAGFLIIAEIDARIVGYAALRISDGLTIWQTGDHVGVLETISVLPAAMGKGVGSAMTYAAIAELQERGVTELMGNMTEGKPDSHQFFMNKGGVPINRVLFYRLPPLEGAVVNSIDASLEV